MGMYKVLFLVFLFAVLFTKDYSQSFNFERIDQEYINMDSTYYVKSHYRITNYLNVPDSIRFIRIAKNLPVGISSGICDINACYPDFVDISIAYWPPGISQTDLYVYFADTTFGVANGQGTVTYRAERTLNTSEFKIVVFGVTTDPIGIKQISTIVKDFSLEQNYPNPFNPTTKIGFAIHKSEHASLRVYDILGGEVKVLVNEFLSPGEYEVDFDAKGLSSGMYYYSLRSGDYVSVKKMVLVK